MLHIKANKLTFKYSEELNFGLTDLSFNIHSESRIGLIGTNGCGKTTLIKILLKQLSPHHGSLTIPKSWQIGYLPQNIQIGNNLTVMEYLLQVKNHLLHCYRQLQSERISDVELGYLYADWSLKGGFDFEARIHKTLEQMNLKLELNRQVQSLSGGERTKVAIGQILLTDPDLLILDEPTNNLDLKTLKWIEQFLQNSMIPFLIISHDRSLLDSSVRQIWELKDGHLKEYIGNYSHYKKIKEQEFTRLKLAYEVQHKKVVQLEKAQNKLKEKALKRENFKSSRSVKKNGGLCKRDEGCGRRIRNEQGLMKKSVAVNSRLDHLIKKEEAKKPRVIKKVKVSLTSDKTRSRFLIVAQKITKSYANNLILDNIDFCVNNGDKIAILGANGSGKSTLLKIITGKLTPDNGSVYSPSSISIGFYTQEFEGLNFDNSVLDEVTNHKVDHLPLARIILGQLKMDKAVLFQKVKDCSPGERGKLALAKILLKRPQMLVLDEPTNHLEIAAREALEEALKQYNGTLVFVSHDPYFCQKLATKVFTLNNGKLMAS